MPDTIYHYNSAIIQSGSGYRLFYRTGNEPKMIYDRIATCLLTEEFGVIQESHKFIDLYSDGIRVMGDMKRFFEQEDIIEDGDHCEDPRVIEHNGDWFLTYTDGFRVGIAKLSRDSCDTLYTHYLTPPIRVNHTEHDGREKNWIPFSDGEHVCFLYSDNPRQILRYSDTGSMLVLTSVEPSTAITQHIGGVIRGGCPPVRYDHLHMIWFFHTAKNYKYTIGAYITRGFRDVVYVIEAPILEGVPQPRFNTSLVIKDNVVYPCGAVVYGSGWMISMGINDYKIGLLYIKKSLIEKHLPADILSKIQNHGYTNTPLSLGVPGLSE
jgi:hypothetical protein